MDLLEIVHDRGHLTGDSEELKPFPCPDAGCEKSFNRKSDLQRHYRIHTNERPYKCVYRNCGKAFIQRSALTVHHRVHTGEKPHKCEYIGCGKCFSDSSSLARHRRIHTGKRPYRCQVTGCGKSFCRKTTLTKHQRRTHKVRDLQGSCPEEYANSEQDAEGSETEVDTPRNSVPPYSQDKARTLGGVAKLTDKRTGITRRATPSSLHPSVYGMVHHGSSHGPLTPHSPLSTYSTPSSSRNSFSGPSSGAFTSACDEEYYSSQQHPPTPRSPHHQMLVKQELDQQPTSDLSYTSGYSTPRPLDPPTIHTTQPQDLRIACPAPTTYDLVAEAQALQHSPGSLSSCSSISTASHTSQDYFCQAPAYQPASYPSNPHTISAVDPYPVHLQQIAHYQHQVPQSHLGLGAQFQPQQQYLVPVHQHTSAPAPQVWYEVPPYQHQLMAPEPQNRQPQYYGGQELLYVKEEPVSHLMTTPQGSFCE